MPDYSLLFVLFRLAVTSPVSLLSNAISIAFAKEKLTKPIIY
jgi:hypothetical protein